LRGQCVITREIAVAEGVFAPGHLGELTQVLDFALVDAVAAETGTVQRRVRLLPTRVVIYFVLALALFEHSSYRRVWAKLTAGLVTLRLVAPTAGALTRARRRVGPAPLRALFEAVSGVVGRPSTPGVFWRGMRTVAIDATTLHVPQALCRTGSAVGFARREHTRLGGRVTFGYPLLRLSVLVECGTRAVIAAVSGPEREGEKGGENGHAERLLHAVRAGMLVLADAGYDSWTLLRDIAATEAQFLCRATARRTPLVLTELSDGSYLSVLGHGRLKVRIIEAWITVTWADGTVTREQWRLVTSLLDHRRYPAGDLVDLYHRRWQVETTYLSIKSTILDGRVLRSHRPADIDQEIWALLTVYQTIIRIAVDAIDASPDTQAGTRPDRISFTVALQTAADQVTAAVGIITPTGATLVGVIGRAVLDDLLPPPRTRGKARTRKNPTSKYAANTGAFPTTSLAYTITTTVTIMKDGLTPRSRR
jgi:Insertion element 4 transposase N-terminal/Transposase DDE domain